MNAFAEDPHNDKSHERSVSFLDELWAAPNQRANDTGAVPQSADAENSDVASEKGLEFAEAFKEWADPDDDSARGDSVHLVESGSAPSRGEEDCFPRAIMTTREQVVCLYTGGSTIAEVAQQLKIGRETAREHLVAAGVKRRGAHRRDVTPAAVIQAAIEGYRAGATLHQLAERAGVTPTGVRAWLMKAGVDRRKPGVVPDQDSVKETAALYESGLTLKEVAERQGLHPWTVGDRLKRLGVQRRRRGRRTGHAADG